MRARPVHLKLLEDRPLKKPEVQLVLMQTRDALREAHRQRLTPKRREEIGQLELIQRLAQEVSRLQGW
jgi:hypothetical protein